MYPDGFFLVFKNNFKQTQRRSVCCLYITLMRRQLLINVQNKPLGFASVKGWLKAKTEGQVKTKCGKKQAISSKRLAKSGKMLARL